MSSRASSLAWSLPELPAPERLVLLKLADICDDDGRGHVASVRDVCKHSGFASRTDFVEAMRRFTDRRLLVVLDDVAPTQFSFVLLFVQRNRS